MANAGAPITQLARSAWVFHHQAWPVTIGEVQRTFVEVRKLPRKQQYKIIEMVQALVEKYKRKAS